MSQVINRDGIDVNERWRAQEIAEARYSFRWHITVYALVNTLFVGLWYYSAPFLGVLTFPWPIFPIVIWAICPLTPHYFYAYGRYPNDWIQNETDRIMTEERRVKV